LNSSPHKQIIACSSIQLDSIDSTNDFALKLIAKSTPNEGTVISADFQTHGKGQRDNIWQSPPKENLLFSVILYPPELSASNQFYLSMMTSSAIISFLKTFLAPERLSIKWPNDLYFDDKKIGGILIQNNLKGFSIESTVIGIGININQRIFDPKLPNPTSLSLLQNKTFDLEQLKTVLYEKLDLEYQKLRSSSFSSIKASYESVLYNKGIISTVNCNSGQIKGTIIGVEADGRLLLNIDGKIKKLSH